MCVRETYSKILGHLLFQVMRMASSSRVADGGACVVLTSSTGSTNPPGAAPDAVKNETDFLSDPDVQKANKRYSPAAKTLMEAAAFEFVGRDRHNRPLDDQPKASNVRLCIMNPSLILGPQLQPGPVSQALFLCAPFLPKKEKCPPFLEFTSTP